MQVVGILVLVDEHIAELSLIVGPNLFKALEEPDGVEDDVVKVQGVGLPQPALILHIHIGNFRQPKILRRLALSQVVGGQLHGVLGPGDVSQHRPGGKLLVVHVQVLEDILDDPQGVVGVVDGEGGGKA